MTTSEDEKAADRILDSCAWALESWPATPEEINIFVFKIAREMLLFGIDYGREHPINTKDATNEIHLYDPKGSLKIVDVYADKPSSPSSAPQAKTDQEI